MSEREKLIELLKAGGKLAVEENHKYIKEFVKNHGRYNSKTDNNVPFEEIVADYLLANGVVLVDTNCVKRENLPLIQQAFNMPLDELAKLIEAKQAGRIVELPCKVGDVVYCVNKMRSGHWEEDKYVVDDEGEWKTYEKRFNLVLYAAGDYYLTKADAEKAVAKETAQNGLAYATPNFELLEG